MQFHFPAAADSEQALEEVFRHTPVGVVLTDLHGTILDANVAFCSMLGRERADVVGREFFGFMHPEDVPNASGALGSLREEEVSSTVNVRRWLAADMSVVTAKVTASIVRSHDSEAICGIAFVEDIGARLQMEQALRESEGRYRRVVEDQTELIVRCMPDGTRTFVNEAYCRYAGVPAEELIGKSFFPYIPEAERAAIYQKYASLTPENPVATEEHHAYATDGTLRWHRWTDRGIFDAAGNLIEIQAVGRDVTDEKEAQDQLRRSEEKYRRLYGALPIAVWETDFSQVLLELRRRGIDTPEKLIAAVEQTPQVFFEAARHAIFLTANDTALAMSGGSTPADLQAWLRARYTNEAALMYVRAAAPLILGDVRVVDIELPLMHANGERLDFLQRLARQPKWNTHPMLTAITLDVTERKRTERDLEHQKHILEEAEILARIGSWESDPSRRDRVYGSAGFWRIFDGTTKARFGTVEEVIGCFREDFRPVAAEISRSLRESGERPDGEVVLEHPDGTTIFGRGAAFAERNESGEIVRLYGVVQDVTEQRRMEEAAQREREALTRADKMISLGVLVSGVAHEVNNPNHAIMLNMSLLRDAWRGIMPIVDEYAAREGGARIANLPWDELRLEVQSLIDDVEHAAERIRGIVTELRSFALDPDPSELRAVSINDVVRSSLRLLGNHIRKATQKFSMNLAPDLPFVQGNARRLEQVLVNLVINACQALPSTECAITIETGKTESHVFVRVIDEGRGISRDDLRRITEPFFTTKRAVGGTGLGLAVSERIAQEHGGTLTFESEPGRGTMATLAIAF